MKSPLDWKISPPASPFGDLAISRETHGFASSDYSEFAFIGRRFSVVEGEESNLDTKGASRNGDTTATET
jgi:hypothetical protein